jgi:hypothetical protein
MADRTESRTTRRLKFKFYSTVALGIIAIMIFASFVYSGFNSRSTQLSAYSDNWNDLSKFRKQIDELGYSTASIISSPTILLDVDEPDKTLFVAVGVERAYTATESRIIYDFVRSGGSVIIADDYGYANSISEYYFSVSFLGHRLWDQKYDKNPQLVMIDVDPDRSGTFNFDGNILFNNPTALISNSGALAMSTNLSWVDVNGDGVQNIDEIAQQYPVVVKKAYDEGSIVFISDPSPFINDMWDRHRNAEFITSLVMNLIDAGGTVIFDESRHMRESPVDSSRQAIYEALVILTTDDQLRWLTAIIVVLVMGLLIIAYDHPQELIHRFNIAKFKISELNDPNLTPKDTERMRYVFLEKVRIHLGLSMEEFRDLTKSELEELIGDPKLSSFALDSRKTYFGSELSKIFRRITDWPTPGAVVEVEPYDDDYDEDRRSYERRVTRDYIEYS